MEAGFSPAPRPRQRKAGSAHPSADRYAQPDACLRGKVREHGAAGGFDSARCDAPAVGRVRLVRIGLGSGLHSRPGRYRSSASPRGNASDSGLERPRDTRGRATGGAGSRPRSGRERLVRGSGQPGGPGGEDARRRSPGGRTEPRGPGASPAAGRIPRPSPEARRGGSPAGPRSSRSADRPWPGPLETRSGISSAPSNRSGRPPGPRIGTWRRPSGSARRSSTLWSRPA